MINAISTITARRTRKETIQTGNLGYTVARQVIALLLAAGLLAMLGCSSSKIGKKKDDFFTSGSREADQRATQRMAQAEQLAGSGEGAGEKGVKKAVPAKPSAEGTDATDATNK